MRQSRARSHLGLFWWGRQRRLKSGILYAGVAVQRTDAAHSHCQRRFTGPLLHSQCQERRMSNVHSLLLDPLPATE
jgi:hypothetical protein